MPFRNHSADEIYSIAVIHHLPDSTTRSLALNQCSRVNCKNGETYLTVWRKWRSQLKKKLISKIREKQSIDDLVNHYRPWKNSNGEVLGIRFYHYYTWKELHREIHNSNFILQSRKIMGGKLNDGNFLVRLLKK